MPFDLTNFISGLAGAGLGAGATLLTGHLQRRATQKENEKQRNFEREKLTDQHKHALHLQNATERHDKDMQLRGENIRKTGIASMKEIGGG